MARKLRVQYEGAIYHVMNRGDHRDDKDRQLFLHTLGQASAKTDSQIHAASERLCWLRVDRLLGEHGVLKDSPAGRAEFQKRMELRRSAEEELETVLPGWCLGSEAFRKELLAQMSERRGVEHFGQEIRESAQEKANRIVARELKKLRWGEAELSQRRKGDPAKLRMALRLRRETTMTLSWIAQRLQMGARIHLSHLMYWHGRPTT
jgi:hypothetical protein